MSNSAVWVHLGPASVFPIETEQCPETFLGLHLKGRLPTHLWHVKILYSHAGSLNQNSSKVLAIHRTVWTVCHANSPFRVCCIRSETGHCPGNFSGEF